MENPSEIFTKAPDFHYSEEMNATSPEEFGKIIQNRRSIRVFTDEKVPQAVMEQVLDWALLAPNSSNLQCWEFYWVKDPQKKSELVKACLNQPAARTAQELIVCVARLNSWKRVRKEMIAYFKKQEKVPAPAIAYYEKLVPVAYSQGPLSIFGFGKRIFATLVGLFRPIPREPMSRADMRVWAHKTTALACQNIMMGFSAHGFDTCPMEGLDSCRVKNILGLGRNAEIVMGIAVGKRDKKGLYGPRIRMPKEEFIKVI
ncbi:MAG: nitroreductase family protein [Bacteriovoracia bacterium]